jgi:branched-subunit amino acid aminotransferase/4-amino-4-deoxychorismate lyase
MTTGLGPERQGASPGSAEAGVADVAVAESWLVSDGRVRGLDLHWQRFERGCADARLRPSVSRAAVESALPVSGRWFPRVEVRSDGELRTTLLRPAPPREPEVTAWVFRGSDPRRAPRRKGPDLARLGALRGEAARHGAGEALLRDREGRLLEGAYTSLLWWEGDVLWAVPDDAPILDGVTRRLLLDLAGAQDVEVRYHLPTPADLDGREVWLTSALHGIRCVRSSTAPGCLCAGPAHRAPAWQARLQSLATRIGESTGR